MPLTNYIWDVANDSYLMETDGNGDTTAVYTNEPDEHGKVISQRRDGATSYHQFDGQQSTRELTDADESVTDTYTYKAFGETSASSGTTTNPFRYVGRLGYYHDSETSDYYVRARTFSPVVSRFISADPLGFVAGDGNLYRYVRNSPVNASDPSGLQGNWHVHCWEENMCSPDDNTPPPPNRIGCGTGVPGIPLDQLFYHPQRETSNLGAWMQVEVHSEHLCVTGKPGKITIDLTFRWVKYQPRQHTHHRYRVTVDGKRVKISEGNDTGEVTPVNPSQEWPWPPPLGKIKVTQWYAWTGSYTKQLPVCPKKGVGSVDIKVEVFYRAPDGHDMVETATVDWSYSCTKGCNGCQIKRPLECKLNETTGGSE